MFLGVFFIERLGSQAFFCAALPPLCMSSGWWSRNAGAGSSSGSGQGSGDRSGGHWSDDNSGWRGWQGRSSGWDEWQDNSGNYTYDGQQWHQGWADPPPVAVAAALPAAVAAADPPSAAVAAVDTTLVQCYGEDYFSAYGPCRAGYKQHNAALKYFRDYLEYPADPYNTLPLGLPKDGWTAVAVIDHDHKGMGWAWKNEYQQWSWHELIAQLDPESRKLVITGPEGRSCGVVGCSVAVRPNSYDHQRCHMIKIMTGKKPELKLPIWDFLVGRSDGTNIRLMMNGPSLAAHLLQGKVMMMRFGLLLLAPVEAMARAHTLGTRLRLIASC